MKKAPEEQQEKHETYSTSELAIGFNLDRVTVKRRLEEAGIQPVFQTSNKKIYELTPELEAVLNKTDDELEQLKKQKLQAEIKLKEIQVSEKQGELLAASEVKEKVSVIFSNLFREFQRLHKKLAPRLHRQKSAAEISKLLQTEDQKIFEKLRTNYTEFL